MPRQIRFAGKNTARRAELRQGRYVVRGYKNYIDHYFGIAGTAPEKMVYAELSARNIPFYFQNEIEFAIPELDLVKKYRPDIAIPSLKIIIEVQGSYWHSTDEAIEKDAYKFAIYQMLGWTVLAWWDYDIAVRLQELFSEVPAFQPFQRREFNTKSTEFSNGHKREIDDAKGIKTMNYRRGQRLAYKKSPVGRRLKGGGVINTYKPSA